MARNFLTPINLNGLELQGAAIGNLSTTSINAITSGTGRIQYDNTLNVLKYRDNTGWQTISTGGGSFFLGSTSVSLGNTSGSVTSITGLSITGNAGTSTKWASAVNLAGNSVDGSTSVPFSNKFIVQGTTDAGLTGAQFLGALGTGILKNTTSTGVLSIAVAGDFPTLNQNTTGSAGSVANTLTFSTGLTATYPGYNGSQASTLSVVSGTTSVAGIVQLSDSTSTTSSTLAATATAAKAAYDRGSLGVTNAATAQSTADAALPKAGGTMSGAIAMGSNKITGLGTPTAAADAATKDYVDNVSTGINIHDAVVAATTGTIAGVYAAGPSTTPNPPGDGGTGVGATITYSATGVVTLDTSVTLVQGDRVLVKDGVTAAAGASSIANGIYVVTTAGAVGTAAVLTRATDSDNSIFGDLAAGDLVYVIGGNTYGGDQFVQTVKGTATQGTGAGTIYSVKIGTDAVSYTQFSGAGSVPYASTSVAGIASFDTNSFTVDAVGAVVVKSAGISVGQGGTGASTLTGILKGNGTSAFTAATGTDVTTLIGSNAVTNANNVAVTNDVATATAVYPTWVGANTGNNGVKTSSANLAFVPSTGILTATGFSGPLTGNVTGNITTSNAANSVANWGILTTGTLTIGAGFTSGHLNIGAGSTWTTGDINIGTGASGSPTINIGSGNGTSGTATIAIGNNGQTGTNKSTTTIYGNVSVPQIATATGLLKTTITTGVVGLAAAGTDYIAPYGSTTANTFLAAPNGSAGTPSFRTVVYADLPTSSLTGVTTDGIARKKTGTLTANSSTTAFAINHAFGQWVTAQLFDATSGNLVEVDVTNASTSSGTTTFTFATAPTTGTNYQYVIIG